MREILIARLVDIPEEKVPKDALGQSVIAFLPRALDERNIVDFVHKNSHHYTFIDGKLILSKSK